MKIIYWNTKNIKEIDRIKDIIKKESPELFFLSEIEKDLLEKKQNEFNHIGYEYFPNPGCDRVSILRKIDFSVELHIQSKYFSVVKEIKNDIYIISIHLPSQMFQHIDALKEFIRDFRESIDSEIGCSLEKMVLVIGDFNVNPHEKPMIDFDGFVATNSINSRTEIKHLGKVRTTYFNPTWQLYSRKHFPGTKFFNRPSASSYDILEFHFLDQVVISQKLLNSIIEDRIDVIEKTDNFEFLSELKNTVQGSDHLPLLYQFKI